MSENLLIFPSFLNISWPDRDFAGDSCPAAGEGSGATSLGSILSDDKSAVMNCSFLQEIQHFSLAVLKIAYLSCIITWLIMTCFDVIFLIILFGVQSIV